jgi:hypothetical protein
MLPAPLCTSAWNRQPPVSRLAAASLPDPPATSKSLGRRSLGWVRADPRLSGESGVRTIAIPSGGSGCGIVAGGSVGGGSNRTPAKRTASGVSGTFARRTAGGPIGSEPIRRGGKTVARIGSSCHPDGSVAQKWMLHPGMPLPSPGVLRSSPAFDVGHRYARSARLGNCVAAAPAFGSPEGDPGASLSPPPPITR